MTIDNISAMKIKDVDVESLQRWIAEEINSLFDDVGQKADNDQQRHIAKRLKDTFIDKYRNWEPGKIHSIFQSGITGKYGKGSKITLSTLLYWITSEDKLTRGENVSYSSQYYELSKEQKEYYKRSGDKCLPFIIFCHKNWFDVSSLTPEQYELLRDRYNNDGEQAVREDLKGLPRYTSAAITHEFIKFV